MDGGVGSTHLYHTFSVGNIGRFPTRVEVGGPGGKNFLLLVPLLTLSATYNVPTIPTVAHTA